MTYEMSFQYGTASKAVRMVPVVKYSVRLGNLATSYLPCECCNSKLSWDFIVVNSHLPPLLPDLLQGGLSQGGGLQLEEYTQPDGKVSFGFKEVRGCSRFVSSFLRSDALSHTRRIKTRKTIARKPISWAASARSNRKPGLGEFRSILTCRPKGRKKRWHRDPLLGFLHLACFIFVGEKQLHNTPLVSRPAPFKSAGERSYIFHWRNNA